jgi:hypothetical protein
MDDRRRIPRKPKRSQFLLEVYILPDRLSKIHFCCARSESDDGKHLQLCRGLSLRICYEFARRMSDRWYRSRGTIGIYHEQRNVFRRLPRHIELTCARPSSPVLSWEFGSLLGFSYTLYAGNSAVSRALSSIGNLVYVPLKNNNQFHWPRYSHNPMSLKDLSKTKDSRRVSIENYFLLSPTPFRIAIKNIISFGFTGWHVESYLMGLKSRWRRWWALHFSLFCCASVVKLGEAVETLPRRSGSGNRSNPV